MDCNPCQEFLDIIHDQRYSFVKGVQGNWDNHRIMLPLALELTKGLVIELGSGEGSTPFLRKYCKEEGREFRTYDHHPEWSEKMGAVHIADWDKADIWHPCGLLFVDHAPGEHRYIAIERMKDKADIIVVHDSEDAATGYLLAKIWHLFKYRLNFNRRGGGAGVTAISNTIDLNKYRGLRFGQYKFDYD